MPTNELKIAVIEIFHRIVNGRSCDDVVIDDEVNAKFIAACQERFPGTSPKDLNWLLFNLRKSGELGPTGVRSPIQKHDEYLHAAEIAARAMEDRYGENTDRVLCDPQRRKEFDDIATEIAPEVSTYRLRKAALRLRKGRKLRPELIKRIADWQNQVLTYPAEELRQNSDLIPRKPGIYIFRDDSGYLYIGEAKNLRSRVSKHLDHSDRKALAHHLWKKGINSVHIEFHVFAPESDGAKAECRRAYESELIAKRTPRFNAKP